MQNKSNSGIGILVRDSAVEIDFLQKNPLNLALGRFNVTEFPATSVATLRNIGDA